MTGLLALGIHAQETNVEAPKKEINTLEVAAKKKAEEAAKRTLAKKEAEHFEIAAAQYLESAGNKCEIATKYHTSADQIIQGIENLTETNYPSAWIEVGNMKREAGRLEKQIGNCLLRAGACLDNSYKAWKELGQDKISLINKRKGLPEYSDYFDLSRQSYNTAKDYFIKAKDKEKEDKVTELMANENEQTATIYKAVRKEN